MVPLGSGWFATHVTAPGLQLAAAVDSDPAKIGRDVGELCGIHRLGVTVVGSIDHALVGGGADAAVLATVSDIATISGQIESLVARHLHVVTTCEELSFPWETSPSLAARIDAAARAARVAVLATGVNPGFLMDCLPLALTAVCQRVQHIGVTRIQDASARRLPFQRKIGAGLTPASLRGEEKARDAASRGVDRIHAHDRVPHGVEAAEGRGGHHADHRRGEDRYGRNDRGGRGCGGRATDRSGLLRGRGADCPVFPRGHRRAGSAGLGGNPGRPHDPLFDSGGGERRRCHLRDHPERHPPGGIGGARAAHHGGHSPRLVVQLTGRPMNVLLILEDALRPDHLGCYGYRKATSPNIDNLAREGVVFKNAFATASHTLPPIVSLLMGQWSCTHGVVSPARFQQWVASASWRERDTPLKMLAHRGFLVDGEMVMRWRPLGFTRDTDGGDMPEYFHRHRREPWFFMAEPYPTHLPYNPPEEYFRMFLDPGWKRREGTEERLKVVRSCLIVHPSGVMSKLEAGESEALPDNQSDDAHKRTAGTVDLLPQDEPAIRALYDGEVRVFDDLVGSWVARLGELGILDETLIVITADHGEELMERGHVGHCSCNLKGTLHDESIRVPLILRYPPGLPKGKWIDWQVSHVDLMPTIFDLLGTGAPRVHGGRLPCPPHAGLTGNLPHRGIRRDHPRGMAGAAERRSGDVLRAHGGRQAHPQDRCRGPGTVLGVLRPLARSA